MKSGKWAIFAIAATLLFTGLVATAGANNLDRDTATDAAREVARRDCRDTSGCKSYRVFRLHRVSRHKAVGKIEVISVKNGSKFSCIRQVVIKLDHFTGEINFATSARRCTNLGPAYVGEASVYVTKGRAAARPFSLPPSTFQGDGGPRVRPRHGGRGRAARPLDLHPPRRQ